MPDASYMSWGRYPRTEQRGQPLQWRSDPLPDPEQGTLLPWGNGRSYGDVCLNRGSIVIDTAALDHFIAFDTESGRLRCESGVKLADILRLVLPAGWFLPVTPGTCLVTVGGAIANDVHGKNHHREGTFGCHVLAFELLRSDGNRMLCSPAQHADYFAATIGGLGLTGLITWAEIQLRRVESPMMREESLRFTQLQQFFTLSDASDSEFEYTVAWVDCLAQGDELGRGLFSRANHAVDEGGRPVNWSTGQLFTVPFCPPVPLVNRLSLQLFNALWYRRQREKRQVRRVHFARTLYPLDRIGRWNLMYGPRGLLQYQCVLPGDDGRDMMRRMLQAIASGGQGSFLAVLKMFGNPRSPGLLSFPRPGVTLALDFPCKPEVFRLLDRLDAMTLEVGGAVYPAKDARMSGALFRSSFPQWEQFARYIDPGFSSSFWRRVTEDTV